MSKTRHPRGNSHAAWSGRGMENLRGALLQLRVVKTSSKQRDKKESPTQWPWLMKPPRHNVPIFWFFTKVQRSSNMQFLKAQGANPSQSWVSCGNQPAGQRKSTPVGLAGARSWPMMAPWQPPSPGTTSPLMPLSLMSLNSSSKLRPIFEAMHFGFLASLALERNPWAEGLTWCSHAFKQASEASSLTQNRPALYER